ncbi:MAG TPA: iron ABC transporter permease, partial [Anaerolineae bacterium]|nr:iron ABC transporter permease [Anaerolineae bacterium]
MSFPRRFLFILPLAFLAIFFFNPLATIIARGLAPDGVIDLSSFGTIVGSPFYLQTVWFTFWQAIVSTLLTIVFALPAAYVFARFRFRGKAIMRALTTIPFVLPTVVVAAAFSALIGPRGWINEALKAILQVDYAPLDIQNTIWIILLAHIFYNFTIVLRIVGGFWTNLDPQIESAARVLGANRWRTFREITLPLLKPALLAAALLVFIFDFTSFGVVLILGGPQFNTIETAIYRNTQITLNLPMATALTIVQLICTFIFISIYTRLQARASHPIDLRSQRLTQRLPVTRSEKYFVVSVIGSMLVLLCAPLIALIAKSFVNDAGFTLDNFINLAANPRGSVLFVPPLTALSNSLVFASVTMFIALVIGVLAAYSSSTGRQKILEPFWMLPLGASAVTLGFGFLIGLPSLRSTWLIIPLAHSLVAFPFVVRSITPALRSIRSNLREAASIMGANPMRAW